MDKVSISKNGQHVTTLRAVEGVEEKVVDGIRFIEVSITGYPEPISFCECEWELDEMLPWDQMFTDHLRDSMTNALESLGV